ncbi:MAG: NADH-quinone oxidoreductase subunit NuoG [Pseudomonadota bacterium]
MSDDDLITIEVDGKPVQARKGQMIIEATDAANAYVPRFCYHEKLSIAANCRMCLVEVERAPKPLPACATPVADGMKVSTKSAYAVSAQRATMEFLLINHPLDCPICDQGGECELQDLAMGYGRDISRYTETKRVVKDKNIGPLVSTDMTRCIHCTRCVRFGQEIQGIQELGTTGRGENMQIGTYIENSVDHELSGNIIDLCPVGALNNKPYRYSARAWEMLQQPLVSPHDCTGSNLYAHTLRGTIKRIVPRANEQINETWIADRDRFSYEGIYAEDRLQTPRIKTDGQWREVSWPEALDAAAAMLREAGADSGWLMSPTATLEEGYLAQRVAAQLGSANIDHRLARRDVSDQSADPLFDYLGMPIADIERCDSILLVGSVLRQEAPILAHRVRKAVVHNTARVSTLDITPTDYHFERDAIMVSGLVTGLAAVAKAAYTAAGKSASSAVSTLLADVAPDATHERCAQALLDGDQALILLGQVATSHRAYSELRLLASALATLTGAKIGTVSAGANAAGLALSGILPHRGVAGKVRDSAGMSASEMIAAPPSTLVLWNVEPAADLSAYGDQVTAALQACEHVIAITPFFASSIAEHADIVLPIGTFAETAGTFVSAEGRAQSWQGVASPIGEARPGWKVLRVLGNALEVPNCEYLDVSEVRDEALNAIGSIQNPDGLSSDFTARQINGEDAPEASIVRPIYEVDSIVRRARALQLTGDGLAGQAWRHASESSS